MLWYLAHPIAPDAEHTYEENMADARLWWVRLLRRGINVCAPWYGLCHALDDTKQEDRRLGMNIDQLVLSRCNGIIATGHKISDGMQREIDAMLQRIDDSVIDLTGEKGPGDSSMAWEDALTKICLAEAILCTGHWIATKAP